MQEVTPQATDSPHIWRIEPRGRMRVPAIIYADQRLIEPMDHKVFELRSGLGK